VSVTGNVNGGNLITTGNIAAGNIEAGNLKVTGIEAVTTLNVSGDTLISGNLTVSGTTLTANVQSLIITDPVLGLGAGANGAALVSNDGLDRGVKMFYFTDAEQIAFMGFDNSEGKMLSAANVSIANNVVTVNSLGTTVVGTLESTVVTATGNVNGGNLNTTGAVTGNGRALTSLNATNIDTGTLAQTRLANANVVLGSTTLTLGTTTTTLAGLSSVTSTTFVGELTGAATTAGTVTTAAQPNITSVGTLTALAVTGNTTSGNFIGTLNGSGANVTSIDATNIASGTLAVARGGTGVTSSTGTGAVVLGTSPTFTTQITVPSIVKSGTNAVGNIGQTDNRFNNVFARASSASYADLAEIYLTDSDYPAGTVVVFGGEKEVTESDQYADARLAGVISTNPAFVMNDSADGQPIALQGRVPCSVVGNIQPGDLITTSNIAGVGTKLDPTDWRPGTVLGKALENYNSSEPGVIEVVVGRV
jgi:hypothetical protein